MREKDDFLKTNEIPAILIAANYVLASVYFFLIAFYFKPGNPYLFGLLVFTEVFHIWQAFTFWYTISALKAPERKFDPNFNPPVDVFITVCGEPVEIVEETAIAALNLDYPKFKIYLLNDGFVRNKKNWQEIEALAERLKIGCITRRVPGGAKAGNINNGLALSGAEFVAVFDADHVPRPDFLRKTVGYFSDDKVAFVQTPQYYKNHADNYITSGAWDQQELFFGPICRGKDRMNSAFMCGTNMVLRRSAIMQVGGMCEDNIAEDFATSVFVHQKGWKSVYVPELLAEGLAPEDFRSYSRQQYRWARGSLEVLFWYNPLFRKGLSFKQRLQYLASASYYFSGAVILINAILPVIFFFTGQVPLVISTMSLAAIFLPYIFLTVYTLGVATNFSYSYKAIAFSIGLFDAHLRAIVSVLFGKRDAFSVTAKRSEAGNYIHMVIPQLIYDGIVVAGVFIAAARGGITPAFLSNLAWAFLNVIIFSVFMAAAFPQAQKVREPVRVAA